MNAPLPHYHTTIVARDDVLAAVRYLATAKAIGVTLDDALTIAVNALDLDTSVREYPELFPDLDPADFLTLLRYDALLTVAQSSFTSDDGFDEFSNEVYSIADPEGYAIEYAASATEEFPTPFTFDTDSYDPVLLTYIRGTDDN